MHDKMYLLNLFFFIDGGVIQLDILTDFLGSPFAFFEK